MPGAVSKTHKEIVAEARKRPEYDREYRRLAPLHQVMRDIVNLRYEKGLTQAELAKKARTHQSRISKIESGEQDIQLSTLSALAEALDADLEVHLVSRQPAAFYIKALEECTKRLEDVAVDIVFTEEEVGMQAFALPVSWGTSAPLKRHEQAHIG